MSKITSGTFSLPPYAYHFGIRNILLRNVSGISISDFESGIHKGKRRPDTGLYISTSFQTNDFMSDTDYATGKVCSESFLKMSSFGEAKI